MNFAQLSKARFFLTAALAMLVGGVLFGRPVLAAPPTVTVYKTPT